LEGGSEKGSRVVTPDIGVNCALWNEEPVPIGSNVSYPSDDDDDGRDPDSDQGIIINKSRNLNITRLHYLLSLVLACVVRARVCELST
jgi:hypothetical protein